jgi:heat shock protein HslJ
MKLKMLILSLCASLMIILQGCDDIQDRAVKETPMTKEQLADLCAGEPWQLQKMVKENQEIKLLDTTPITFTCDQPGNVAGMASINRYFGAFTLDDNGTLNWQGKGFMTTKMGGPPEHMQQEQAFLETLGNTSQGRMDGSNLLLESRDKSSVLEFSRATDSP